jgi:hypothetical protein
MKNTTNFYDIKKTRSIIPTKKTNYVNSIIYKEISNHFNDAATNLKNNKDNKETINSKERKIK